MTNLTGSTPVIDLFAGPGGLNEGFSRLGEAEGNPAFSTIASFEMESSAVRTLLLRSAFRTLLRGAGVPDIYYEFLNGDATWDQLAKHRQVAAALDTAADHVHQVELGSTNDSSSSIIRTLLKKNGVSPARSPWVLIGGPPCQAYSIAGRSRRANDASFASDQKHFLYQEYLRIIRDFSPPVFVMENVKGLLSARATGEGMFARIKKDLESPGGRHKYTIRSLTVSGSEQELRPADFVIRAEEYGVPQRRHRVILLGIRDDWVSRSSSMEILRPTTEVSFAEAVAGLPSLRSGISPTSQDALPAWLQVRDEMARSLGIEIDGNRELSRGGPHMPLGEPPNGAFGDWVIDKRIPNAVQHESRGHMKADLERYFFAAAWAEEKGHSPRLSDYPKHLLPLHKNISNGTQMFNDRFRVQVSSAPATTIVSHISKDGHYYIHPDTSQMRSLTVREAARLQSFPDNYFFMGNRTQQYHQVGNAVPPRLAYLIASIVNGVLHD